MGFPDRIERTMELAHPPGKVWAALTTAEGLAAWFGEEADIDLRPGGAARMKWGNGYSVEMRVERVEEPTVFGFTWQRVRHSAGAIDPGRPEAQQGGARVVPVIGRDEADPLGRQLQAIDGELVDRRMRLVDPHRIH